jgi:hypothetical protein
LQSPTGTNNSGNNHYQKDIIMTQFTPSNAAVNSTSRLATESATTSKNNINPTLARDLVLTITAAVAFMQVCTYSNGWFLPIMTYMIAVAALFTTINRHSSNTGDKVWFYAINMLGCSGLIAALWFSGKMAVMF